MMQTNSILSTGRKGDVNFPAFMVAHADSPVSDDVALPAGPDFAARPGGINPKFASQLECIDNFNLSVSILGEYPYGSMQRGWFVEPAFHPVG
jgi:hypothetical protein